MVKRRYPWIAQQDWKNVLFIHFPLPPQYLQNIVPAPFKLDTYDGQGWISVVLFTAANSRLRCMPKWLSFPSFHQMNIRTYVRFGNERGVYFFSIHTNSSIAAASGNLVALPFRKAPITIQQENETFQFAGERLGVEQKGKLQLVYKPNSISFIPEPMTLAHFLTERYCIWMMRGTDLVKAPISHTSWQLQEAEICIGKNQHTSFSFTKDTLSHYSTCQHAMLHPFEKAARFAK